MNGRSVTGVYSTRSKAAQAMGVEAQYADIMLPVIYEGGLSTTVTIRKTAK